MVMDTLPGTMSYTPILSAKVSINEIKGASHKNGDVEGICKRSLKNKFKVIMVRTFMS